jgi:hypothetical protein
MFKDIHVESVSTGFNQVKDPPNLVIS